MYSLRQTTPTVYLLYLPRTVGPFQRGLQVLPGNFQTLGPRKALDGHNMIPGALAVSRHLTIFQGRFV